MQTELRSRSDVNAPRSAEDKSVQRAAARHRRQTSRLAKRNKYDGLRAIVCSMIDVPYKRIAAPRNRAELRANEWGGIAVDPATAKQVRLYGGTSWEILGESAGA